MKYFTISLLAFTLLFVSGCSLDQREPVNNNDGNNSVSSSTVDGQKNAASSLTVEQQAQLKATLVQHFQTESSEQATIELESLDNATVVVLFTQQGFQDDSIAGDVHRVELSLEDDGNFQVKKSTLVETLCARGKSSEGLCL